MNSENWQKVEELLNAALEIEPKDRQKFLAEIGAEDLRREVESLLVGERGSRKVSRVAGRRFFRRFF